MSKDVILEAGQFDEIISIIDNARSRALKAVNTELIQMYWDVGKYLSELCADARFGDKVINEVAEFIAKANPNLKEFNRRGLYRMKQFYETYKDDEFVSPLVTQISWTAPTMSVICFLHRNSCRNLFHCCNSTRFEPMHNRIVTV